MSVHENEVNQHNEPITKRRLELKNKGYLPIPVCGKTPRLISWTDLSAVRSDTDICGWLTTRSDALSTGVVHDGVVMCLDLDCYEKQLMQVLHPIVLRYLPGAKTRIGCFPKAAYFYQAVNGLVGEPTSTPLSWTPDGGSGLAGHLEVRGVGGQTLVDGIHPDTGKPYVWKGGFLPSVSELPTLDAIALAGLLAELKQAVNDFYKIFGVSWDSAWHPGRIPGGLSPGTSDMGVSASADFVRKLLSGLPNKTLDLDWNTWFYRVMMPVRGALLGEGDGGYEIFESWSADSDKHTDQGCRKAWDSYIPLGHVGVGTLIHTVKSLGDWSPDMQVDHEKILDGLKPVAGEEFSPVSARDAQYPVDCPDTGALAGSASPSHPPRVRLPELSDRHWSELADDGLPLAPRKFLYGKHVLAGAMTLLGGPGGVSKTTLALLEAVCMVTGQKFLSDSIWFSAGLKVLHLNRDEPQQELRRRVRGIRFAHQLPVSALDGLKMLGQDRIPGDFMLVRNGAGGSGLPVVCQDSVDWLTRQIERQGAEVLQLDPLVSFCSGEGNDHFNTLHAAMAVIHDRTGVASFFVHHTRKGTPGVQSEALGDADSFRGGGVLTNLARSARVLRPMAVKEGEDLGVLDVAERRRMVSLNTGAKANYFLAARDLDWLRLTSVGLGNAKGVWPEDVVGVHEIWAPSISGGLSVSDHAVLHAAIAKTKGADTDKWTLDKRASHARSIDTLAVDLGLDVMAVRAQVDMDLRDGVMTNRAPGKGDNRRHVVGLGLLKKARKNVFS